MFHDWKLSQRGNHYTKTGVVLATVSGNSEDGYHVSFNVTITLDSLAEAQAYAEDVLTTLSENGLVEE